MAFAGGTGPPSSLANVRLDIRFKTQLDWRTFDPEIGEDQFDRRQVRGGINGEIGNHFEFQLEHDLYGRHSLRSEADDPEDDECLLGGRWRDVFVSWRTFRQAEITVGRFKVPFGREELISFSDIDFAYRALVSTTIPPARDKGVMVNGRFLRRGVTYEVGVFDDDGDNGRLTEPQFAVGGDPEDIGPSFAGRVTGTPLRPLSETVRNPSSGLRIRSGRCAGGAQQLARPDRSMEPKTSSSPSMSREGAPRGRRG